LKGVQSGFLHQYGYLIIAYLKNCIKRVSQASVWPLGFFLAIRLPGKYTRKPKK